MVDLAHYCAKSTIIVVDQLLVIYIFNTQYALLVNMRMLEVVQTVHLDTGNRLLDPVFVPNVHL